MPGAVTLAYPGPSTEVATSQCSTDTRNLGRKELQQHRRSSNNEETLNPNPSEQAVLNEVNDLPVQASHSARQHLGRFQRANGIPEGYPEFNEIPPHPPAGETSRPERSDQPTTVVTEMSASQRLAISQRNKYY
jgi:hypothetical protein